MTSGILIDWHSFTFHLLSVLTLNMIFPSPFLVFNRCKNIIFFFFSFLPSLCCSLLLFVYLFSSSLLLWTGKFLTRMLGLAGYTEKEDCCSYRHGYNSRYKLFLMSFRCLQFFAGWLYTKCILLFFLFFIIDQGLFFCQLIINHYLLFLHIQLWTYSQNLFEGILDHPWENLCRFTQQNNGKREPIVIKLFTVSLNSCIITIWSFMNLILLSRKYCVTFYLERCRRCGPLLIWLALLACMSLVFYLKSLLRFSWKDLCCREYGNWSTVL